MHQRTHRRTHGRTDARTGERTTVRRPPSRHRPRPGGVGLAADAGASIFKVVDVSRHKSVDVLRGYVRRAEIFRDHAGSSLL